MNSYDIEQLAVLEAAATPGPCIGGTSPTARFNYQLAHLGNSYELGGDVSIYVEGGVADAADDMRLLVEMKNALPAMLADLRAMREALNKLARLGNGDRLGNSEGNRIAQDALAKLIGGDNG